MTNELFQKRLQITRLFESHELSLILIFTQSLATTGTQAKQYTSTIDCFRKIFASEGPRGFYKGVIPRMGRVVPGQVRYN